MAGTIANGGKRCTIVIDKERNSKLHEIQGKAIGRYDGSISFSDVINFAVQYALEKGFNVKSVLAYKESNER